jgi:metallo-beta-lactamase family protein
MRLSFHGGTDTVTGSKALVEHRAGRLLVDCGLFQGVKALRLRNWSGLPLEASTLDAVVLTHAHLDHSGYVPRLVKLGYRGRVHSTAATRDLCGLLLPDSGHLLEEEAGYADRHGFSRHKPPMPLYTQAEALSSLKSFKTESFGKAFEPVPGLKASFTPAGHLLGAASLLLHGGEPGSKHGTGSLLFSGDLGRRDDLMMQPPAAPPACDWLVIESTYGDRLHPTLDPLAELASVISRTAARGGHVIVPAFAVGRAQALLHAVHQLKEARRIPDLPVFLNSPMAAGATALYQRHAEQTRLTPAQCAASFGGATIVSEVEASKRLNELRYPAVIISASGMATGGRVLHHLKAYAPDARHTILFVGFQAAGTRGAALVGGADQIKIHGEYVPVRAEVVNLEGLSAHADRAGLLEWLGLLPRPPRRVFVNHGEPVAADGLRLAIEERFGWAVTVPSMGERYELE